MNGDVTGTDARSAQPTSGAVAGRSNYRWVLAFLAMAVAFTMYLDRVNLGVTTPAIMDELHFTKVQLGLLGTVFFMCYAAAQIPAGPLVEFFGHRRMVSLALVWWSTFTSLSAACSSFSMWVVTRALFGIGEAPGYPGLTSAMQKWFPTWERGKAAGLMLFGSKIAPSVGFATGPLIMIAFGWRAVFWIFGVVGVVVAIIYFIAMRTYPHDSKFVNQAELEYISGDQPVGMAGPGATKKLAPWGQYIRSPQVWCLGIENGMASFTLYTMVSWLPLYLMEAHNFSLKSMGFAAAIPELSCGLGNVFCGWACDWLIRRRNASSNVRAWFGGGGQLFYCFFLYMAATTDGKVMVIWWLSVAMACIGLSMTSTWAAASELGGQFAGSVAGAMNFIGNVLGAFAPAVIGWIATSWGWQAAIVVTSLSGMIGAISWIFVRPDRPLPGAAAPTIAGAPA